MGGVEEKIVGSEEVKVLGESWVFLQSIGIQLNYF